MKRPKTFTAVITVAIGLAAVVVVGLVLIYSGLYNVAAVQPESAVTDWVLSTTMDESVRHHAQSVVVPADLERMDLHEGGEHYREMCVTCHGAPGVQASELAKGLNPQPPDLQESAADWSPAELYWIIRNGVKMTGMPGFQPTHTERQLWAITAFVRRLPKMTADEYKSLTESPAGPATGPGTHDHSHGESPE